MLDERFTAAAAQIEPVFHNKAATLDKTCHYIRKAGNKDADIVVFPETYFPGYPYWRGSVSIPRWSELMIDLQRNSLHVEDKAMTKLSEVIDDANVNVVLGANELSDRQGSETVYNTIFYFNRKGNLMGRHRKLMPTHEERAIWGRGDPQSLSTYDTDIGRLGGLICYENHMTLSKAALSTMGEEIHAAVWPGFWIQDKHPGNKRPAQSTDAIRSCDIYPAMREYAFETQSFVISCSAYMSDDIPEKFSEDELGFNVASGGSMLINPAGIVKAGPLINDEGILTADFTPEERRATKAYFDAVGHYTRWDATSLSISDQSYPPVQPQWNRAISAADIGRVAEEYDVSPKLVEEIVERVLKS